MSETIWVCSRWNTAPKDEEKVQVTDCHSEFYTSIKQCSGGYCLRLPKSDYIPCPAPEQWERVLEVSVGPVQGVIEVTQNIHAAGQPAGQRNIAYIKYIDHGYRVVSLVVERRKES